MLLYYRLSGVIAVGALFINLILVLAAMIMIKAAFTLPGLAGLVLTIGIAVDANVLIFERMREELRHGAALRMAIRNGFGRATRTIIDANMTTIISAVVMYTIGSRTDQRLRRHAHLGRASEHVHGHLLLANRVRHPRTPRLDHHAQDEQHHRRDQHRFHGLASLGDRRHLGVHLDRNHRLLFPRLEPA